MRCQKCGSPKEGTEAYDTAGSETLPEVTDSKLLEMANAGANVECPHCKSSVRNLYDECAYCGGPKTLAAQQQEIDQELERSRNNSGEPETVPSVTGASRSSYQTSYQIRRDAEEKGQLIGMSLGMAVLFFLFSAIAFFSCEHENKAMVSDHYWSITSTLSQRHTLSGEGWSYNEPSSHFNDSCETRQDGTEDCHPHDCHPHSVSYDCNCTSYECNCHTSCRDNGNGFSSCSETCSTCERCSTCSRTEYDTCYDQCPVYHQWCKYEYYNWTTLAVQETHGSQRDPQPYDGFDPHTTSEGPQAVSDVATMKFWFIDADHKRWVHTTNSTNDWNVYTIGSRWIVGESRSGRFDIVRRFN